ncbi:DUF6766 family protein [Rhizobium wenxiniae]|uniref:DUF6766 family protein n=1 Tax=Rhizobium wenxiniae TaxID=1737357 RepID=UPI003C135E1B
MRFLRDNGLTIVLVTLTMSSLSGMLATGWIVYNDEHKGHGAVTILLPDYVFSGPFMSALFENWESEFLQMAAYVVLTAFLFQRGSAESRDTDETDDAKPKAVPIGHSARTARLPVTLYSYSLGIALFGLFVVSFVLHLRHSTAAANADAQLHGDMHVSVLDHLTSAQFWFESLQNWQSEFLSTAVLVVLSIVLRFRGSPESKPVNASSSDTGA